MFFVQNKTAACGFPHKYSAMLSLTLITGLQHLRCFLSISAHYSTRWLCQCLVYCSQQFAGLFCLHRPVELSLVTHAQILWFPPKAVYFLTKRLLSGFIKRFLGQYCFSHFLYESVVSLTKRQAGHIFIQQAFNNGVIKEVFTNGWNILVHIHDRFWPRSSEEFVFI